MNWLDRYMSWTKGLEAPTRYHYWSALAVAGHVLGRNVWMVRMAKWAIFPGQIMVTLVGPTAVKKDTAMNQALSLLYALPKGTTNVLPSKTSAQDLLCTHLPKFGTKRPNIGFITTGEMGTFFSKESFMDQMITLITELWNAPTGPIDPVTMDFQPFSKVYAFRQWQSEIRDPAIGGLMAITPEGIATELPESARKRGFMGRVLWVYEVTTDRPPNSGTSWDADDGAVRDQLMVGLERLASLRGPVWFTKQGREWFDSWFHDVYSPAARGSTEEASEIGYLNRKPDHLLRVAITLAAIAHVSDENAKFQVRVADLEHALYLLNVTERMLPRVLGEVGRSPSAEKLRRFLHYLEKGPRRRHACMVYLHKYGVANVQEFENLLAYAKEMQAIVVREEDGRKTVYERTRSAGQALRTVREG
jgi:hypothetical protein